MTWSDNPTENQLLTVFHSPITFKIIRHLMKNPMTIDQIRISLKIRNYARIYTALETLQKKGLVRIKEYKIIRPYSKVAVFTPTIKNLIVNISKETTITTDTKLVLHSEEFV